MTTWQEVGRDVPSFLPSLPPSLPPFLTLAVSRPLQTPPARSGLVDAAPPASTLGRGRARPKGGREGGREGGRGGGEGFGDRACHGQRTIHPGVIPSNQNLPFLPPSFSISFPPPSSYSFRVFNAHGLCKLYYPLLGERLPGKKAGRQAGDEVEDVLSI